MNKKQKRSQNKFEILEPPVSNKIVKDNLNKDNYPVFCFKYLSDASVKKYNDDKFFYEFIFRLKKLSELGWEGIRKSSRHDYGMESIPISMIKPKVIPESITPDTEKLHVFRANGNNLPFVGIQIKNVFRILFIETKFGGIYNHK